MAKRFIDTKIWDKPWYRKLHPKDKLLWIYIITKCDHAGIIDGDWEAASFFIGYTIEEEKIPLAIKEKMISIESEQYFIPSFVEYQYGQLKHNSKPHLSVIKRLENKGLHNYLQRVTITPKDTNKYKKQSIDKRKEKFIIKVNNIIQEKKYSDDETYRFIDYWTEMNNSGSKMRFEMQETFEISRRISTWVQNNKNWKINKKENDERKEMQFTGS